MKKCQWNFPLFFENPVCVQAAFSNLVQECEGGASGVKGNIFQSAGAVYGAEGKEIVGFKGEVAVESGLDQPLHHAVHVDISEEGEYTLKAFLDVTYRAWEYVLNNPEEAIDILAKYHSINTADVLKALQIEYSFLKTQNYKDNGIGYIDAAKMQQTYDLVNTYQTELGFGLEDIYDDSFLPATPYTNFSME